MQRPDDPPGPENVGVLAFLVGLPSALLPLWFMGYGLGGYALYDYASCAEAVQIAPNLFEGALCAALSTAFIAAPLWLMMGGSHDRSVEDTDAHLSWWRPRVSSRLLPLVLVAVPVTLGMGLASQMERSFGTSCEVLELGKYNEVTHLPTHVFPTPSRQTCLDPGISLAARQACKRSWLGFGAHGGGLVVLWAFIGLAAVRTWRRTRHIELDEVGVKLDGVRLAYVDLDQVWCSNRELVFVTFDNQRHTVQLRPEEVPFARWLCTLVEPLLPGDEVEDRPVERARVAQLL